MTDLKSEITLSTEKAPFISIIMSVYNGEKSIDRAISSITKQTLRNFEFLIMNDGSLDKSLERLCEWAKKDSRIKIFTQQNQGINYALNFLLRLCRGKYISRMDVDDFSFPTRMQEQFDYLERNKSCDLVSSGVAYMDKFGRVFSAIIRPDSSDYYKKEILITRSNPVCHGAVMLRSNALVNLMPLVYRTRYGQDFDLWFRLLAKGYKFGCVQSVLYAYQCGSELQLDYEKNIHREMQKELISQFYGEGELFNDTYCLSKFEVSSACNYSDFGRKKFNSENTAIYLKRQTAREGCLEISRLVIRNWHLLRGKDKIKVAVYPIIALFPIRFFYLIHDLVIYMRNRGNQSQWLAADELARLERIIAE